VSYTSSHLFGSIPDSIEQADRFAAMPVPFETLIPYGIIVAVSSQRSPGGPFCANRAMQMFGISGAGMSKIRNWQNGGKRQRRGIDQWDRVCRSGFNFFD
jgi:hypothetical protein